MSPASAAIVTVGTELLTGIVVDTNAADIAVALTAAEIVVSERVSVPDDVDAIAAQLKRLVAACDLVFVTGGLGPTHDDVTREGASHALQRPLVRHVELVEGLREVAGRHLEPWAAEQVYRQADVLDGAMVLPARVGTAPGMVAETPRGSLVLLPGPPREMRSLLPDALDALALTPVTPPAIVGTTGIGESDVQVTAERVLAGTHGVALTLLARPGEVRAVLLDRGAGPEAVASARDELAAALGDRCFTTAGESLAGAVLRLARGAGVTIAAAESCTGGMVAAALTDVPGSSDAFLGGVVSYANRLKIDALAVPAGMLAQYGAVSEEVAAAMAEGVRELTGADLAVSVTGVAGPGGGTVEKPVGLVWFAVASPAGTSRESRRFPGDRATVRTRATAAALDLVRLAIAYPRS